MMEVALKFERRTPAKRPALVVEVSRIERTAWEIFKRYHYMSAELVVAAKCFGAFVDEQLTAFVAVLWFPHPKKSACCYKIHRLVTLPDWQGIGIGMLLLDTIASAYSGLGHAVSMPAMHPSLIRQLDRSPSWALTRRPGIITSSSSSSGVGTMGGRAAAAFRYCGARMDSTDAERLIA